MSERGVTLPELLVVLLITGLILTIGITYSLSWLGREDVRSMAFEVQTHLQLARIQAVSRNRACIFRIDSSSRRIFVSDLNDPGNATDDIVLADITLSAAVAFTRPDTGSAITLTSLGSDLYQATFASDGSVSSGAGEIVLHGGDRYEKVVLFGAGGVRVEHWDGSAWALGS